MKKRERRFTGKDKMTRVTVIIMTNNSRCIRPDTLLSNFIRPYARTPFISEFDLSESSFYLVSLCHVRIPCRLTISRSTHSGEHSSSLFHLSPWFRRTMIYTARLPWSSNITSRKREMSLHELEHARIPARNWFMCLENATSTHVWFFFSWIK